MQKKSMRKINLLVITSTLSLTLVCQKLFAADAGQFYVGLELGSAAVKGEGPKNEGVFIPNQKFKDSDSIYGLHAGFQFNDWFAVEFGIKDLGSTSHHFAYREDIFFLVQPNDTQTLDTKGASLSGVFTYAVGANMSLLGVIGVASMDFDMVKSGGYSPFTGSLSQKDRFSEQGLGYGIGARYALNDSYGLRAQLHRNEVGDFTIDLLEVGLEYSF